MESIVDPPSDIAPEQGTRRNVLDASCEWKTRSLNPSSCATHATQVEKGQSDPSTQARSKNDSSHCSRRRLFVSAIAVLVVVCVVVPLSLLLRQNDTGAPPASAHGDNAVTRVRTFLLHQNWSDTLSLLDPLSPQYRVVNQLAMEQAPLTERLQQRYAFLVLWYGLGNGALNDGIHECDWEGFVQCDSQHNIVALTMGNNVLDGTVLEEIGMLSNLGMSLVFLRKC